MPNTETGYRFAECCSRIVDYELGEIPAYIPEPGWNDCDNEEWIPPNYPDNDFDDDDIPF